MKQKWIALLLCLLLTGCSAQKTAAPELQAKNLMETIEAEAVEYKPISHETAHAMTCFSQTLLQHSAADGRNTLLSPLSILCALSMTANGAEGETLAQMEAAFGVSAEVLSGALSQYQALEQDVFTVSNSIWLREDPKLTVLDSFLRANAEAHNAAVFRAPFDESTVADINNWIDQNTKGRIQQMVQNIPDETKLYLVNALTFDGVWLDPYTTNQVRDAVFTTDDGTQQPTELMYNTTGIYLEDELASGFMQSYSDSRFAFAALRPNDGVTLEDYLLSLEDGELYDLLTEETFTEVRTAIPKFQVEHRLPLEGVLQSMGMTNAFSPELADLSGIGSYGIYPLYIGSVSHATYLKVNETGTEAAAATIVEVPAEEAPAVREEPKVVYLDKPFVYLIWDRVDRIPLFIGVFRTAE